MTHDYIVQQARETCASAAELAQIRAKLDASPALCRAMGDLARITQTTMLGQLRPLPEVHEAVVRVTGQMHQDLAEPDDTPLEQLLIAHIVLCWVDLHLVGISTAQAETVASFERLDAYDRLLNARQRRYLRAIETLARVRRLHLGIQINVAEKQINIVSGPP